MIVRQIEWYVWIQAYREDHSSNHRGRCQCFLYSNEERCNQLWFLQRDILGPTGGYSSVSGLIDEDNNVFRLLPWGIPLWFLSYGAMCTSVHHWTGSGGRLNIKMSYQYRDPHVKDKTVSPTVLSLTWESPYLGKTVFILRRGPDNKDYLNYLLPAPSMLYTLFTHRTENNYCDLVMKPNSQKHCPKRVARLLALCLLWWIWQMQSPKCMSMS